MSDASAGSASARRWLVAGALAGVAIAAATLVRGAPSVRSGAARVPPDAVAVVNGQPITREALARYIGALARERGRIDLDPAEQRRMLDRLIDEELLLQHGVALGLERSEPNARRAIVSAVVDTLTSADLREPERADLEAFYRSETKTFARAGPVQVELVRVPIEGGTEEAAKTRAAEIARRARAGESMPALAGALGAPLDPPLPDGPIAIDALRDRVGGIVVQALVRLQPGEIADPVRAMDGWWVVRLVAREPDVLPPLDDVLEMVRQEWIQKQHDEALQRELAQLRATADVTIADPALAGAQ